MFCPTCQSDSYEHTLLDPSIRGYACKNGDVFFTTLIEQAGGMPKANTIRPPPMNDDVQILKFWLTDSYARARLPNQLALVCRRIVEILESHHHIARVDAPFAFCPTCGEALSHFDSGDVHMHGLKCGNSHEFFAHGSTVYFMSHGVTDNLSAELDDDSIPQLLEYYAGDNKWVKPYVHPQLRSVLERFGK